MSRDIGKIIPPSEEGDRPSADRGCSFGEIPIHRLAFCLLLILPLALSGCGLDDIVLLVGKWQNKSGSVDFRLTRFVMKTTFSAGAFTVTGDYELNTGVQPKAVDCRVTKIEYAFSGDTSATGVWRGNLSPNQAETIYRDLLARAATGADVAQAQKLRVFLEGLSSGKTVPGIYNIEITYGTYLQLGFNRPGTERPWDMNAAYARDDY